MTISHSESMVMSVERCNVRKASECWCPMRDDPDDGKCIGSSCAWWLERGQGTGSCGALHIVSLNGGLMEDKSDHSRTSHGLASV